MKKTVIVICICILSALSFLSGCINVPKELTQFSIVSFDAEPGIIYQGEFANLSWVVMSASSVNIDNGIGSVALTGHRIIQPTQTTTYILAASNATTTKSATVTIIVNYESNESHGNQEIIISSFEVNPSVIDQGESANLSWAVTGATSVSIDNGIGTVPLTGKRLIAPLQNTIYTLVASNSNTSQNVYVTIYVRPAQQTPQRTPNIACIVDNSQNGLIVASADVGVAWADITITAVNITNQIVTLDSNPTGSVIAGNTIGVNNWLTVHSGDRVTITLRYDPTNSLIGTWAVF
jgi:hypothetical protein